MVEEVGVRVTNDLLVLPSSVKMKMGRIAPSKLARFLLVGVADSSQLRASSPVALGT